MFGSIDKPTIARDERTTKELFLELVSEFVGELDSTELTHNFCVDDGEDFLYCLHDCGNELWRIDIIDREDKIIIKKGGF